MGVISAELLVSTLEKLLGRMAEVLCGALPLHVGAFPTQVVRIKVVAKPGLHEVLQISTRSRTMVNSFNAYQ
ncbi:hypothetical protein [Deinococcus hohokamensis]|uniref:Uncharacterized protein n=1 Tax=Deinococcus hohokamensis TaxID=309883 RepID=A0ABV9I943_9DEIO